VNECLLCLPDFICVCMLLHGEIEFSISNTSLHSHNEEIIATNKMLASRLALFTCKMLSNMIIFEYCHLLVCIVSAEEKLGTLCYRMRDVVYRRYFWALPN
jgi:hypothetical protein